MPETPTRKELLSFLWGRVASGLPMHSVEIADLAELLDPASGGTADTDHLSRAEQANCCLATVRRQRQRYNRSQTGDPDAPWLRYVPGGKGTGQRSRVFMMKPGDSRTLPLFPVDKYVEKLGKAGGQPFFGVTEGVTLLTGGSASLRSASTYPVVGVPPAGPGGAVAPRAATVDAVEVDAIVGEILSRERASPGGAPKSPLVTQEPQDGTGFSQRVNRICSQEGGGAPQRPTAAPKRLSEPRAFALGTKARSEALKTADRLLEEAKLARVLTHLPAYATRGEVADGLAVLVRDLAGWEPAVRCVRVAILRLIRQRAAEAEGADRPTFPGRAVLFFRRGRKKNEPGNRHGGPRQMARTKWWARGLEMGWDADGWVPVPEWHEVPGWAPATDPAGLELGTEDRDLAELSQLAPMGDARAAQIAQMSQSYYAQLDARRDGWELGQRAYRAVLTGKGRAAWVSAVLEDYGGDFAGTIRKWQQRAADGSDIAASALTNLDRLAGYCSPPAPEPPEVYPGPPVCNKKRAV